MAAHERSLQAQLQGITEDQSEMLAAARIIIAAATDDGVSFDVASIAAAVHMPVETVQAICASPAYQNALRTQFLAIASHALTNGARKMDQIVQGDYSPTHKIGAYRALVETIKAFDQSGGKPPAPPPEGEYEAWLKEQEKKNASAGRTRGDSEAEQGQGDGSGAGAA